MYCLYLKGTRGPKKRNRQKYSGQLDIYGQIIAAKVIFIFHIHYDDNLVDLKTEKSRLTVDRYCMKQLLLGPIYRVTFRYFSESAYSEM